MEKIRLGIIGFGVPSGGIHQLAHILNFPFESPQFLDQRFVVAVVLEDKHGLRCRDAIR